MLYLNNEAFIATLKHFISRRDKPASILFDNDGNFVGANKELSKMVFYPPFRKR